MDFQENKSLVLNYNQAIEGADSDSVSTVIEQYTTSNYYWYGLHPFGEQDGAEAVSEVFWRPFLSSWSAVQRRMDVFFAGFNQLDGKEWVASMGHFMGLFDQRWLGIPRTGKIVFLPYAEFHCIEGGRISRSAFFCDIIKVMQQAGVYPLPPQTGAAFIHPGPRSHDGLLFDAQDSEESRKTLELIERMIDDLNDNLNKSDVAHKQPEFLARTWHPDMIWYGPAGIGATFTIPRYVEQHQEPFRAGLKNKVFNGHLCRFGEGSYGGFFGWPNLTNTAHGGFLGLPGNEVRADMRVVDIYRRDGDKLAENWVFIDLLHWLNMQGLDVLARMQHLHPV